MIDITALQALLAYALVQLGKSKDEQYILSCLLNKFKKAEEKWNRKYDTKVD